MTTMTRDEYAGSPERKAMREHAVSGAAQHLRIIEQAAVSAENMTGHPAWDRFLSYIQAAIEETERHRGVLLEMLSDPIIVDHDTLIRAKMGLKECDGRLDAWRTTILLPKEIMEQGDRAKNLLDELPEIGTA